MPKRGPGFRCGAFRRTAAPQRTPLRGRPLAAERGRDHVRLEGKDSAALPREGRGEIVTRSAAGPPPAPRGSRTIRTKSKPAIGIDSGAHLPYRGLDLLSIRHVTLHVNTSDRAIPKMGGPLMSQHALQSTNDHARAATSATSGAAARPRANLLRRQWPRLTGEYGYEQPEGRWEG
jgi:hypothetical protein